MRKVGGALQRIFSEAPAICLRKWYETGRSHQPFASQDVSNWETDREEQLAEPGICRRESQETGRQTSPEMVQNINWGNPPRPSKELFLKHQPIARKKPQETNMSVCLTTFAMAENPKSYTVREPEDK